MIVMQVHKAEFEVLTARAPDGSARKVLVLIDPATGIQVHAPMPVETAQKVGGALSAPVVYTAAASEMPPPPAPAPRRAKK